MKKIFILLFILLFTIPSYSQDCDPFFPFIVVFEWLRADSIYCRSLNAGSQTIESTIILEGEVTGGIAMDSLFIVDSGGDTIVSVNGGGPTVIDCDFTSANSAADGTRFWDNLITMTHDPAASAEVSGIYGRINKTNGSNGTYTINGIEGVAGSSYADEAGTFRGIYGRTYTSAGATATMRTAIGGEFSARASYSGGTECVAENGTAFIGTRIWMAPYFTDASFSNINNSHGLWILNETPNNSWGKYIDRAITIDATTYGSAFNYNIYSDCGKYYQRLNGATAGSGLVAGERSTASGDDWMTVLADDYRTLTSGQEYRAGYFRNNIRSTTPSNPTCEVTGIEGVAGSYIADEAITFRGGHFRTYVNADATSTMRTNIGLEASARASYNGGTECVAENGTAFVGHRIWMAPYFTSGSVGNVNNFWALWIYGEHATQRNADAAIKISDAGGGFTVDAALQSGETIDNATDDMIEFQGVGGDDNTDLRIDLDGTHPVIDSPTDGTIGLSENIDIDGKIDADYTEASAASDGTRYYDHLVGVTSDPAASAEISGGYFRVNKTDGSNGVYTINGLEGVAGSSYADEAGTFRGVYGRTYTNADATSTMRTAIGGEFSARASYNGGTECVAENGTCFTGARIWMAPYFTAGSVGNINNFWGLWIYGEHATQRNADAAIKISDAGGGFTDDIVLQSGNTITNTSAGSIEIDAQIFGNVEYDKFSISLDDAHAMASDTLWFFDNDFQATMTIDSIFVRATSDDQDVNVVVTDRYGGNPAVVDAITASTDGVGEVYTDTQTTLTTSSITAGQVIGITKPTGTSDNIVISVYYHVTKQER